MNNKKSIAIVLGIIIIASFILIFVRTNSGSDMTKEESYMDNSTSDDSTSDTNSGVKSGTSGSAKSGTSQPKFVFTDYVLKVGETTVVDGVKITPLAIEQDSRCPINVQCIQAGTVRVSIKYEFNNFSETNSMVTGNEATTYGVTGTLIEVTPPKISGEVIKESDYSFILRVKKKV